MSALCQNCHSPEEHRYLCENCTVQLANMLDQLPWLLDELDARIQRLDRISVGGATRNRRPAELNVIDFDAADTARKTRKTLQHWVETVAERHTGRRPPALAIVTSKQLARWLTVNVDAIARLNLSRKGRHPLYDDIAHLVGSDTDRRGQLVTAINRNERHFAGPCPTIRGYHGNDPIECGTTLYADVDETTVECPTCRQRIEVAENRRKVERDRDLLTESRLLEVLADLGENVPRVTFYRWKRELRIRPKAWLNKNHGLLEREDPRRLRGDPAVYSLARARKLRLREAQIQEAKAQ